MTEPVALSGPQRIIRRVVAERRAGAPDEMIAKYAITEALHLITRHDGPAADCTRCHDATARAVDAVRDSGDMTGASIVVEAPPVPDADALAWARAEIQAAVDKFEDFAQRPGSGMFGLFNEYAARVLRAEFLDRNGRFHERRLTGEADPPEPCPFEGGAVCMLDARDHYHFVKHPSGDVVAIRYGSVEDRAAYPPNGCRG